MGEVTFLAAPPLSYLRAGFLLLIFHRKLNSDWGVVRSEGQLQSSVVCDAVLIYPVSRVFLVILALSLDFGSIVTVAAEPQAPLTTTDPSGPKCAALRERQEDGKQEGDVTVPNASFTDVTEPLSSPSLTPPPSPAAAHIRMVEAELEKPSVEEKSEESEKERGNDVTEQPRKKPFWLEDDDLPPIM